MNTTVFDKLGLLHSDTESGPVYYRSPGNAATVRHRHHNASLSGRVRGLMSLTGILAPLLFLLEGPPALNTEPDVMTDEDNMLHNNDDMRPLSRASEWSRPGLDLSPPAAVPRRLARVFGPADERVPLAQADEGDGAV
ncbi:hypothetical protein N0V88_003433 [Collariella sp. IMI 366227]|nr:hypothetical protein N0V88_003433 [Collariella sp. IMI 366227]